MHPFNSCTVNKKVEEVHKYYIIIGDMRLSIKMSLIFNDHAMIPPRTNLRLMIYAEQKKMLIKKRGIKNEKEN